MIRLSIHIALIVGALSLLPAIAAGESRVISTEEQDAWNAVGRLNKSGPEAPSGCTAALIAPDLILTAAHCAPRSASDFAEARFVAGWNDGQYAAESHIKEVYVHPDYRRGPLTIDTVFADAALLRLTTPLNVTPLPLGRVPDKDQPLGFLAYRNNGSQAPTLRSGCIHRPFRTNVTSVACTVAGGNSGAPLLELTPLGPRVVGVISARWGTGALSVDMQDWMHAHLPEVPSSIFE